MTDLTSRVDDLMVNNLQMYAILLGVINKNDLDRDGDYESEPKSYLERLRALFHGT